MTVDELKTEARKLPAEEFAELVRALMSELPSHESERAIELEWAHAAESRLAELLSGKTKGITRDQANARLDASLNA